ncbi:molybdate transport repressor ModE-like protein [Herbaspirillum sp. Sphag1AN]|uniref:LysR substrate-binding domain-containing protein n=1 Tax=unclassified Herbaspirillum TaxID=2624150 RepID=UPI00161325BE|nr:MULTISPECIES: LysR substrate-binding domain-containing protein [unclassified Herbaspirillum]MBB3210956.1 molybdate transport repressor ModE-like protein [Herbaspirillum sp. Sphag1AN]MBB3244585.1 molybdate transport repressor ModE-like protein [Herbaspirillum sp. Sphag64]
MYTRLELSDLRLFQHIAEAGSITGGAQRSHLALASASARAKAMEDALGVLLLTRQRHGVQLTDAGRALLHHARTVQRQLEHLRDEMSSYASGLKAHIRLLANTAGASEFLPEALSRFLRDNPDIDIDLEERTSVDIVQRIVDGMADLGIVADSLDTGPLQTLPLRRDDLVVVVARNHVLARRRKINFAEIVDQDFIGMSDNSALQEHLAGHAARLGKRIHTRVRLRSFDGICSMVEQRAGIGIIPVTAALRCQQTMSIKSIPLSDTWAQRRLLICTRNQDELPLHTKQLLQQLLNGAI